MKKNLWDSTGKNLQTGEDTSRFNENRQFEDIRYDTYTSDELTELKEKLKGRRQRHVYRRSLLEQMKSLIHQSMRNRIVKKTSFVMAGIVVFATTYSLILPALTLDYDTLSDLPGLHLGQKPVVVEVLNSETAGRDDGDFLSLEEPSAATSGVVVSDVESSGMRASAADESVSTDETVAATDESVNDVTEVQKSDGTVDTHKELLWVDKDADQAEIDQAIEEIGAVVKDSANKEENSTSKTDENVTVSDNKNDVEKADRSSEENKSDKDIKTVEEKASIDRESTTEMNEQAAPVKDQTKETEVQVPEKIESIHEVPEEIEPEKDITTEQDPTLNDTTTNDSPVSEIVDTKDEGLSADYIQDAVEDQPEQEDQTRTVITTEDMMDEESQDNSEQTETDDTVQSDEIAETWLENVANTALNQSVTTLTFDGADYHVIATGVTGTAIPDGAILDVQEIVQGTKEYDGYEESAKEHLGDPNAEVVSQRFFDISFLVNGVKVEPTEGVTVQIQFDEAQEAREDQKLSVVHFADKPAAFDDRVATVGEPAENVDETEVETVETEKAAEPGTNIETKAEVTEVLTTTPAITDEGMIESISFETRSFSVFGVVYTVDFHFEVNGKTYNLSIKGGESISLSKLVEALGIAKEAFDDNVIEDSESDTVENVMGSDEAVDLGSSDDSSDNQLSAVDIDKIQVSNETKKFINQVEKVEFSNPEYLWVGKIDEDMTTSQILNKNNLSPSYFYGITENEYCSTVMRQFSASDWVLISLTPFETEETLAITMKNGEVVTISVTDEANAPLIDNPNGSGKIVQTIPNPSGTTIDLFDYWIVDNYNDSQTGRTIYRDSIGRFGWPGYRGSENNGNVDTTNAFGYKFYYYNYNGEYQTANDQLSNDTSQGGNNWYVNNNYLRGYGNNLGINYGHTFKFYPGCSGTVVDYGTKGDDHKRDTVSAWTNNHDRYSSINSYTGDADPTQGLVDSVLHDGYPYINYDYDLGTEEESLDYLFNDKDSTKTGNNYQRGKQKYGNVNNLLYVDPDGYYTYDSRYYSAEYTGTGDGGSFLLKEHTGTGNSRGFWPFGDQVFWHGMHMTTNFSMPANGKVLNPKGEYKDMQFEFSGDDDTWLYLDGILVGDGGGIHNRTEIDINFRTGTVTVTGKKDTQHQGNTEITTYLEDYYRERDRYVDSDWVNAVDDNGNIIYRSVNGREQPVKTYKQGTKHTFEMFYLERGGSESNLYIHYNLVSTTDFSAHKSYHMLQNDPHASLGRNQFQFELIGFDNTSYEGTFQQAIMPVNGTPTGDGTFESPKRMYYPATATSEGYTSLLIGVTEDGNVNFGDVPVQASQAGKTYRYMVREVVDPEAENADGIKWKNATEEQKAEGGFVDVNGITYDGRVYYFTATVQETSPGSGQYEYKKTRYTDATYTVVDNETKFFSFVNGHVEPLTLKVLKKSNGTPQKLLSGAQFSLTRAMKDANDKWVVRTYQQGGQTIISTPRTGTNNLNTTDNKTGSDGILSFAGLTEGHYILEETNPPSGYITPTGQVTRWLLTLTKEDSTDEIKLVSTIQPLDTEGTLMGTISTLSPNSNHEITHEVLNQKLPRGNISVTKSWLKADGTPYADLSETGVDLSKVKITGKLYRSYENNTSDPTVRIYIKSTYGNKTWDDSTHGDLYATVVVENNTPLVFSVGVPSDSSYQTNVAYVTTNSGDQLSDGVNNRGNVTLKHKNGSDWNTKSNPAVYTITPSNNVDIYVEFGKDQSGSPLDGANGSDQNAKNYKIAHCTDFAYIIYDYQHGSNTGRSTTVEHLLGEFTLNNPSWTQIWNDITEEEDVQYTYYLKDVKEFTSTDGETWLENTPEGFSFNDTPVITTDLSGNTTFTLNNHKEGPKTDLIVRKVWGDNVDHSENTISYKIQRSEHNAEGRLVTGPYDYIESGKTAAEVYTLSLSDSYMEISWQKHHDNLPATNGKELSDPDYRSYQYSVVEINSSSNYTATYLTVTEPNNGQPYEVYIIKNNPTDARVSIEKKWMNNGKTEEITSGIPEGAYITGTLKKSYTWQEALGTVVRVYNRLWSNGQMLNATLYRTYDVEVGSSFSLWAIDSSGNEPLNGVSANGNSVSQTGSEHTYSMGNWNKKTNAYVFEVSGPTDVILDWAYNTGFQNGWHYDVDYTQASSSGGQSHDVTEEVGTFRLDASNDWKWVWTDRELDQNHAYTYFFDDVQEYTENNTPVSNFAGFLQPDIGILTQGSDGRWTCSIINEQEKSVTDIHLKKTDELDQNLEGAIFNLQVLDESVYKDVTDVEGYDGIRFNNGTTGASDVVLETKIISAEGTENTYKSTFRTPAYTNDELNGNPLMTLKNLPNGNYQLTEVHAPDGYVTLTEPILFTISSGTVTLYTVPAGVSYDNAQMLFTIPNEPGAALPATGGPGTLLMYGLGAVVAEITGYNMLCKRRKKYLNGQRHKIMKKRWS